MSYTATYVNYDIPTSPSSSDMMTPYKGDNPLLMDEDSGMGMEYFQIQQPRIPSRRRLSFESKTRSASVKRPAAHLGDDAISPTHKRHRHDDDVAHDHGFFESIQSSPPQSPMSSIISAVTRLSTDAAIGTDESRDTCLPTIPGQHGDLDCVSPDTVRDVVYGCCDNEIDDVTIIDCRYPYEYDEGHIKNAINLYTKDAISQFLEETRNQSNKRHVIIFHCEFSSKRGPKMYRHLRSEDRRVNADRYPRLDLPDVYLMDGGYKAFFQQHQTLCYPQAYKPMLHKENKDDLRHFRVKSKSWAAGDKPAYRSRGAGARLSF